MSWGELMKFNIGDIVTITSSWSDTTETWVVSSEETAICEDINTASYYILKNSKGKICLSLAGTLRLASPEISKQEQLLNKIKQLWNRQEYVKNQLTTT